MNRHRMLWALQVLLALVFLVAGITKIVVPIEALSMPVNLPEPTIRALGAAECLGAIGLVLPWRLRILPVLTPAAAMCLAAIVGAASLLTFRAEGVGPALFPLALTLLCAVVGWGRRAA